jgi:hypothetical protein
MENRINLTITSDLFDESANQGASVRPNLTVRALVREIVREFGLPPGNYVLELTPGEALDMEKSMDQLGIQTGAELLFKRQQHRLSRQLQRQAQQTGQSGAYFQPIPEQRRAVIRVPGSEQVFTIGWQPAIIGRPDAKNPASAETLAVNVEGIESARTVSRQHARLTEQNGQYYVESMARNNPTYLNDTALMFGEKRALRSGDHLRVGKIDLIFEQ